MNPTVEAFIWFLIAAIWMVSAYTMWKFDRFNAALYFVASIANIVAGLSVLAQ